MAACGLTTTEPVTAGEMSEPAQACIEVAARYLASEPESVQRALARHRADTNGRCTGCGSSNARWPCATAASARRALELISDTAAPTTPSSTRPGSVSASARDTQAPSAPLEPEHWRSRYPSRTRTGPRTTPDTRMEAPR